MWKKIKAWLDNYDRFCDGCTNFLVCDKQCMHEDNIIETPYKSWQSDSPIIKYKHAPYILNIDNRCKNYSAHQNGR